MPLVSIITPMYYSEKYVKDFLHMMSSQDYKNIEIICIVDGSPDNTYNLLETIAKEDNRIKAVNQEHANAGVARNFGFSISKGDYVMFLDVDDISVYTKMKFVYLDINKRLVKYNIASLRLHGNKFVVSFKGISAEESNLLIGRDMYLPLDMLPKLSGNQFYFHEVIGFEVIDEQKGNIGTIKEIIDNVQPIMITDFEGKEVLIPMIDEVIQKVDREKKNIRIKAPEGLIDIYLSEKK